MRLIDADALAKVIRKEDVEQGSYSPSPMAYFACLYMVNTAPTILDFDKILKDLKIYGGCSVCQHNKKDMYSLSSYCEFGGCNGGGNGKIQEDRWEYDGLIRNDK